ncbi:hypothetical protein BCR44DRAFT_37620, partial [Catenaria anguillulae PL171]
MKPSATFTVVHAHESPIACLAAHTIRRSPPLPTMANSMISADDGGTLRHLPLSDQVNDDRCLLEPFGQAPGAVTAMTCHGVDVFCAVLDPDSGASRIMRFLFDLNSAGMNQPPRASSVVLANDEINHMTLIAPLRIVLATGDCGSVFAVAMDSLVLLGQWRAHGQMCIGVHLLAPLDNQQLQVARALNRPLSIDLLSVSMGYSIKTWKVRLLGSKILGQPAVTSDLDLCTQLLPSLRGAPTSGTIYNPPIICSYLSTTSHTCQFSSPPVHIFGLGGGSILALRQRPPRASPQCTVTFPWPYQGNRTGPWRGWEGLELQSTGHGYLVEQLAFVQGSNDQRLIVSGCTDGTLSIWDMSQLFVTGQPVSSVASVGVKVSALAVAIANDSLVLGRAGPRNQQSVHDTQDKPGEAASIDSSLIVTLLPR